MKKLLLLLTAVVLMMGISTAQVTLTIGEVTPASENSSVTVPINVTGFSNIGAISLKINYDPNVLTFQNISNAAANDFLYNATNGQISIAWASLSPINAASKLMDLNFQYINGTSNLTFVEANCEIATVNGQIQPITLTNGKVNAPSGGGGSELASFGGKVWNDLNENGIKENGESGVQWVTVELYDCNDSWKAWAFTDVNGDYVFNDLEAGDYYVKFYLVDANSTYGFVTKDAGGDDSKDSDVDVLTDSTGRTVCTTLSAGENDLTWFAGISNGVTPVSYASIGNFVWNDINKNGLQDNGEVGVGNVTVKLINNNFETLKTTTTNNSGNYTFDSLLTGTYGVEFVLPSDFEFSPKNVGGDQAVDSDPDATHGRVDPFVVTAGENITSVDAGIFATTPTDTNQAKGSIGNMVYVDANKNGVFDSGEKGLEWVTIELYDCNDNWQAWSFTDANGNYLFDSLAAGDYYVKFHLVDNNNAYRFTSNNITALTDTIGKTTCISLAAGQNYLSANAGVNTDVTPPPAGTPNLLVSISDNTDIMPDSGQTTTYTISYSNSGTGSLLNASIKDTLPGGVSFVSATNGGQESGGVVEFTLGTLSAGGNGMVSFQVMVTSREAEYLTTACLTGKDGGNKDYYAGAKDVNFGDTTSCGENSGVESRGDMAELLLRREWKIRNGLTTPVLAKTNNISTAASLKELVPVTGPYNSQAVESTPFDILGISNAVASYAVDYNLATSAGNRRVAGIFSTITPAPYIYDHTKVVCDRLAGSSIEEIKLVDINGREFYAAKLQKAESRITDYAISFSVYETAGTFFLESKWAYGDYHAPSGASSVYNFQAWSSSYEGTVELVKGIIAKLNSRGSIYYMNVHQYSPEVFIKNTRYTHDGRIHLTLSNTTESSKSITLNSYFRYSQGDEKLQNTTVHTVPSGESVVELPLGILADAQVSMLQASGFSDEVFVSGGAYTYVTGPNSSVSTFNTSGYPQQNTSAYPSGTLMLSGGVYAAGTVNDWVTVVRALTTNGSAYNLGNYQQVRFTAKGTGTLRVIVDMTNISNYNYFAKTITLNGQNTDYILNFSDFTQVNGSEVNFDARNIRAVGFLYSSSDNSGSSNFNFEVTNIGFITDGTTDVEDRFNSAPTKFDLAQNFPNPFNPSTVIEFSVASKEMVTLKVYDMLGQEIANLVNEELNPGHYSIKFDASNLASGVYFYKLHSNSVNMVKKMTLTK